MTHFFKALVAIFMATNVISLSASESADIHRFATYNIRYTNDASDTQANGRAWYVRKQYVFNLIRDYKFDVFGIEEMTGREGGTGIVLNPTTNLSQREEVIAELSEYNFLLFERDGSSKDYSYNAIAYKKEKYELLEQGRFWISPTPDAPSVGWDSNYTIRRTCGWAKLQVKSSGDIFFFFVTHCNYGASLDGPNGANLISQRIQSIAGDYPVILGGDFNMSRLNHETSYRGYASKLEDTRFIADECCCTPTSNGEIPYTTTEWTPLTTSNAASISGSEFDYLFSKHMHVHRRNTITENYGRNVNPSDHYPVMAICSLINNDRVKSVYVDQSASSDGDGSLTSPYKTITEGIMAARLGDVVKVTEGSYSETLQPNRSVILEGGYNHSFSEVIGKTLLDGTNLTTHLLYIPKYYDVTLRNFTIKNLNSSTRESDAAIYTNGAALNLIDVDIVDNQASYNAAGLFANCFDINLLRCRFMNNKASELGGGAYLSAFNQIDIQNCLFQGNDAKSGSAILIADTQKLKMQKSTLYNNNCTQYGNLYILPYTQAISYNFVDNTFANNYLNSPSGIAALTRNYGGSAIYAKLSSKATKFNLAHNTIVGNISTFAGSNKSNFGGAAINLYNGSFVSINNIIAGNYSDNNMGDLYMDANAVLSKEQYNILTAPSSTNVVTNKNDFIESDYAIGLTSLANILDGEVRDNCFKANLCDQNSFTPTVNIVGTHYANKSINILSTNLRLVETSFSEDMNDDGTIAGTWNIDQRGNVRNDKSVPGSCEIIEESTSLISAKEMVKLRKIDNHQYAFSESVKRANIYNLSGIKILTFTNLEANSIIDLRNLASGHYLIATTYKSYPIIIF